MKQLTCEMCGSTDLMKQDGVFVCQSCGCKYSVEEAKKMMMEVSGTVQVSNMAQTDNLLKLAYSSFESKNYEKAEDFCNQVLAIDDSNFEAWKLKGEAINGQISVKNPRIDEVFNCVMMAYKVLSDEEKENRKLDLLFWLSKCFRGEISFWLDMLEAERPTASVIKKAQDSFIDCWNKFKQACEDMDIENDFKEKLLNDFDNFFIMQAEISVVNTWKSTVAYNYYRNNYSNGRWKNNDYRPNDEILNTFMTEGHNLIGLLAFCEKQFNKVTPPDVKANLYLTIAAFTKDLSNGESFKRMESTVTNGYGAVVSRREYWSKSQCMNSKGKAIKQKIIDMNLALAKKYKEEAEEKEKEEIKERIDKYWSEHAEEKNALDKELEELTKELSAYEDGISNMPEVAEIEHINARISELSSEKSALGLFKMKEKKAIQEKIDEQNVALKNALEIVNEAKLKVKDKVDSLKSRINEINNELTKER